MKRVGGRLHARDQPPSSLPAHSESTSGHPPRPNIPRKIWSTKPLAVYLCTALTILLLLLYTWVSAPTLFTPLLHSIEFKIYERNFGQNASRPRITRHGRNILTHSHPHHYYDEPLGHPSWILHGVEGCFVTSLFYIIMEVGINHKPFYLDIDTGSSLTWVHCRLKPNLKSPKQGPNGFYEAVNAGHIVLSNEELCHIADDYRDIGQCDATDTSHCQFDLSYADNLKIRGVIVKDNVALMLHSQHVDVDLTFGCGYEQSGCEYETGPGRALSLPSDGIVGLSKKKASIPFQLHAKGYIRYVIGHCFLPFHKRFGTHVGILLLGESVMTTKGIRWARMIQREHPL